MRVITTNQLSYGVAVLVILPPSETKSDGGRGAPLDLDTLSFPELNPVRKQVADALVALAADLEASRTALGLGATQLDEVDRNADLWLSPTRPALERYTGVLYDALDHRSLTRAGKTKAADRLAIGSALFGVVRAPDPIPAYRLSGGSKLPGMPTLAALWKPDLSPALDAVDDFVVDLRSGVYHQLGPVRGAVTATVMTEQPDGSRKVVSHFNKHYKGLMARELVRTRRSVRDVNGVAAVLADAGQRVEIEAPDRIVVLTD
ncbi:MULTISPECIES: peroxide stress protein YaaA [Gordonia]|uniref:Peroxide stress protein YaaA n=1 Tax=Gordonia hongkongensis TaxID=1701090 RepID=A0ABT6BWT4_9ACTN|nr:MULTISPECIES: peroxide stress protein YaaA [Gordonia]MDF6102175.1 peroxide stress protein YaaA [Gordonia hongkongensis]UPG70152.1 peroxide stress protein YaaA [Gordonia hongkongensis]